HRSWMKVDQLLTSPGMQFCFFSVLDLILKVNPQFFRFFMSTSLFRRPIRYYESTLLEAAAYFQFL
ncbi:hypothetical protein ACQ1ZX_14745, partial [Enterococcus faecalis]|uniref:hypothetical protein n=1 Tax=Enterococcus faecalis TaxID=1351 RepID=UPI003D6AD60D